MMTSMEFCPKCGNLMITKRDKDKLKRICRKCGYASRGRKVATLISEKMKVEKEKIPVMKEKDAWEQYPKTKEICPECGHAEAYWFIQQTRSGDEPPTRFLRCVKCGHSWREY